MHLQQLGLFAVVDKDDDAGSKASDRFHSRGVGAEVDGAERAGDAADEQVAVALGCPGRGECAAVPIEEEDEAGDGCVDFLGEANGFAGGDDERAGSLIDVCGRLLAADGLRHAAEVGEVEMGRLTGFALVLLGKPLPVGGSAHRAIDRVVGLHRPLGVIAVFAVVADDRILQGVPIRQISGRNPKPICAVAEIGSDHERSAAGLPRECVRIPRCE